MSALPPRDAEVRIDTIAFADDSIVIAYMALPTDVRGRGDVAIQHQIRLDLSKDDYAVDAGVIHDRIVRLVRDALEDFDASEPYVPEPDDDDDERGMGE